MLIHERGRFPPFLFSVKYSQPAVVRSLLPSECSATGDQFVKLDECKKCSYIRQYENGSVHCGYDKNIVSFAAVYNPKLKEYVLLTCPKEKGSARK